MDGNLVDSLLLLCCFSIHFSRCQQLLSRAPIFFLVSKRVWLLSPYPFFCPFGFMPNNDFSSLGAA